jgi:hypothetical protein
MGKVADCENGAGLGGMMELPLSVAWWTPWWGIPEYIRHILSLRTHLRDLLFHVYYENGHVKIPCALKKRDGQ